MALNPPRMPQGFVPVKPTGNFNRPQPGTMQQPRPPPGAMQHWQRPYSYSQMNRTPHQQQYGQNQLEPKLKPQQKTQQRQQQSQQQQQQQRQQQSQQQQQQQPQQDRMNRQTQMNPNSMAYSSQQRAPPPKMPCSGGSAAPMSPTKGAYNQRMPPRATSAEPMGPAGLYRSVETPNQLASQREPNGMYRSIQVPKTPRRADMSMTRSMQVPNPRQPPGQFQQPHPVQKKMVAADHQSLRSRSINPVVQKLEAFYHIHAPERVKKAADIAQLFGSDFNSLNKCLFKKYGKTLNDLPKTEMLSPPGQQRAMSKHAEQCQPKSQHDQPMMQRSHPKEQDGNENARLQKVNHSTQVVNKPKLVGIQSSKRLQHNAYLKDEKSPKDSYLEDQSNQPTSAGQVATVRGICNVCQHSVMSDEERACDNGTYYHAKCWFELIRTIEAAKQDMRSQQESNLSFNKENVGMGYRVLTAPNPSQHQPQKKTRYSSQIETRLRCSFGDVTIAEESDAMDSPMKVEDTINAVPRRPLSPSSSD